MPQGPNMPLFRGDYKNSENPQSWLQTFDTQTFVAGWDDAKCVKYFGKLMEDGYEAGDWWDEMKEKEKTAVTTMEGIKALFEKKWPKMKKTGMEKETKKWALMGLRMKEEDVGKTIEFRGREVLSHRAFATQALELATAIGDTSGLLIDTVRQHLPEAIQRLILNESYETWQEFHDSLVKIKLPAIEVAQRDAEVISRFTHLTHMLEGNQQRSAWTPQYTRAFSTPMPARTTLTVPNTPMTPRTPGPRPPATPSTLQTNVGSPRGPPATPATPTRQTTQQQTTERPISTPSNPFYQQQQTPNTPTPSYGLQRIYNIGRPFPANPAGQAAYKKAVADWRQKYSGTRATQANPFPLRPGGSYLDERECFQCRKKGHIGANCPEPEDQRLPVEERNWRADYSAACMADRLTNRATAQIAVIEEVHEEQGNGEESSQ
ncbi:hypothetical protein M422DRAFT_34809 [Sphaerobolus stellatus SS14]|uniref:CCHC-type domain-containing protein n=1 Tax=Sphaerobolus stellatus (strain SS14) TaxID=990650 RepID=A0A0C9TXA9_SPHS4|nr:hypothetical protein M422DRAFT_34809 [Sphaerobolus stellatus SS14]